MFEWLSGSKRIAALERELQSLRASLAEMRSDGMLEAERARAAASIGLFGERLIGLREQALDQADRSCAIEAALAALHDRVATLDERTGTAGDDSAGRLARAEATIELQQQESTSLRGWLLRMERQFSLYAEQGDKAAAALLERIEQLRNAPDPGVDVAD